MHLTEYLPLQTIGNINSHYYGGICRFWYTPVENILANAILNPITQLYNAEPTLLPGKQWYGPVEINADNIGFAQPATKTTAGILYKPKVALSIYGFYPTAQVNYANMQNHRYCIVAQLRAGGFYLLIGSKEAPLFFQPDFSTGFNIPEAIGTSIQFANETKHPAKMLLSFNGTNTIPAQFEPVTVFKPSQGEIITFNPSGDTTITYTEERKNKFGLLPAIEVWAKDTDTGNYFLADVPITTLGVAPNFTAFIIANGGGEGFIKLM